MLLGKSSQSEQALVLTSFSLLFLFATIGLAVDLGWAYYLKLRVQTAADAAATAAAVYANTNGDVCGVGSVSCGTTYTCVGTTPPTTSLEAGCLYATQDGPPTMSATMIENNTAPPGVTGNTPSMWIKATVSTSAHNFFLFGSGYKIANVSAQAISGITTVPGSSCIYVLSGSAAGALSVTGSSNVTTNSCGIYINSSSSTALTVTGSSHVTGNFINVKGGATITGSSSTSPAPTTGAGAVTDPLASLPAPTFTTSCDAAHTHYSLGNSNTAALSPGVYCGGITVTGSSTLTLNSGIYILLGGGLNISNSGILNAPHVMFYNTGNSTYPIAPVLINGSSTVNQTAPTTGTYRGVAYFQDRTQTYSTHNAIANSGTGNITGTYYFPTTAFDFTGSTAASTYAAFVANTVAVTGSSTLQNDPTGNYTGLSKTSSTLIQ